MACNIKNIVDVNDFSCRDTYCYGEGEDIKLLDKKDYHVASYDEVFDSESTKPKNTSLPATNGVNYGTLSAEYATLIVSDKGIVKEIYDDCVVYWRVSYEFCDEFVWEKVNVDINPDSSSLVELDCEPITEVIGITNDI